VFARNPKYFAGPPTGARCVLDRIVMDIIPDQSAELLRLESGQLDMMTSEISPDGYGAAESARPTRGRVTLLDSASPATRTPSGST